jgi:hypothetical protein
VPFLDFGDLLVMDDRRRNQEETWICRLYCCRNSHYLIVFVILKSFFPLFDFRSSGSCT